MRLSLLGTGSADGWPNPFCTCASCDAERSAGRSRTSTSALIDDVVLVDVGPGTAQAIRNAGRTLAEVEHVLITHGHADHLAPEFLLWRSWIHGLGTLHLWGPAHALESARHWAGPHDPVEFHVIAPLDAVTLKTHKGTMQVRALASAHGTGNGDPFANEALIYDITASDDTRLLYATDTAPLSGETIAALSDRRFAVALLEETFGHVHDHGTGHHDLGTFATTLEQLRDVNAITDDTDVVAIHLSHHNPPGPQLATDLAPLNARIVDDGTVIDTGATSGSSHLVIGGARSGKSTFAESLAATRAHVVYVATGGDRPGDDEWQARVALHRTRRPSHWRTIETSDVSGQLQQAAVGECVIVDCLSLWLTSVLDAANAWQEDQSTRQHAIATAHQAIDHLVQAVETCPADVIVVTNEVGMGVVPGTTAGRLFRDLLGIANARVATACTEVTLVVAGRTLPLPGRPR